MSEDPQNKSDSIEPSQDNIDKAQALRVVGAVGIAFALLVGGAGVAAAHSPRPPAPRPAATHVLPSSTNRMS